MQLGPSSERLVERRNAAVPPAVYQVMNMAVDRATGSHIIDEDGNEYIDFVGGVSVMNVGHGRPEVVRAITDQVEKFTHTCIHTALYEPYVELAERLNAIAPIEGDLQTALFNSGSEGIENAVKVARAFTGRRALLAFDGGFHGRSAGALSLTGQVDPYRADFGGLLPYVYHAPFPNPYRNPFDVDDPGTLTDRTLQHIENVVFQNRVAPEDVAAVVVEPVQGEGGFVVPPPEFLPRLKQLCERHGILLVADEIQSGFGRVGAMFGCEVFDLEPDLVVTGKSLAAGMPLSGVTGPRRIMETPRVGSLGGTYGGNPVACAGALAVLDLFEGGSLLEQARDVGETIRGRLEEYHERYDCVGDVRGVGAMRALEIVRDSASRKPAPELQGAILEEARDNGLAIMGCGTHGNVIRLLAPLSIDPEVLRRGLDILGESLESCAG